MLIFDFVKDNVIFINLKLELKNSPNSEAGMLPYDLYGVGGTLNSTNKRYSIPLVPIVLASTYNTEP
jgi:hypothetical protein